MPAVIEMRHLEVPDFSRIEVGDGLDVMVMAGAPRRVSISAPDTETADRVVAEVHGDTLRLSFRHGLLGWLGNRRVNITCSAPTIEAVRAGAGSDVRLLAIPTPQLELDCSAGSRLLAERIDTERLIAAAASGSVVTLAGRCDIAELKSSSGASIDAGGLHASRVEGESSSGSRISADADDGARVSAASGSHIDLRGRPRRFDRHTSGGGSVRVG
jgi:hypothetical protein